MQKQLIFTLTLLTSSASYTMQQQVPQPQSSTPRYPDMPNAQQYENPIEYRTWLKPEPQPINQGKLIDTSDPNKVPSTFKIRMYNRLLNGINRLKNWAVNKKVKKHEELKSSSFFDYKNLAILALNLYTITESLTFNDDVYHFQTNNETLNNLLYSTIYPYDFPYCGHKYCSKRKFSLLFRLGIPLSFAATVFYRAMHWSEVQEYVEEKNTLPKKQTNNDKRKTLSILQEKCSSIIQHPTVLKNLTTTGALTTTILFALCKYAKIDYPELTQLLGLQAASYWCNRYLMYTDDHKYNQEFSTLDSQITELDNED